MTNNSTSTSELPLVLVNRPIPDYLQEMLDSRCKLCLWSILETGSPQELAKIEGIFLYSHAVVNGALLDCLPNLKVVSTFGVGVDHIDLEATTCRDIPVGNTPGAVDGATADMTMALMLAVARNVVVGDQYARGPEYTEFDPNNLLGIEVFGSVLGIIGMAPNVAAWSRTNVASSNGRSYKTKKPYM